MTRATLVQMWFVAVALAMALGVVLGGAPTLVTGATLLVISLMPPALVLLLWPGVQPQTIAEVLHDVDRRA